MNMSLFVRGRANREVEHVSLRIVLFAECIDTRTGAAGMCKVILLSGVCIFSKSFEYAKGREFFFSNSNPKNG